MSAQGRVGIRAARTLLSLLEDSSVEELEAAESILGAKELVEVLQLLRRFKEHEQVSPLTLQQLREIVRVELASLPLSPGDIMPIGQQFTGYWGPGERNPNTEHMLDRLLAAIDARSTSPRHQAESYIQLLLVSAEQAGPEHAARTLVLLRELAIRALTGNVVFFPTLSTLAELRKGWHGTALPHSRGESRRHLATRLLADAERVHPGDFALIVTGLLLDGLRSPTDSAATAMREQKAKKAHGA